MYEYKKIRKWLMIIPFFVLHIFGTSSVISNLFINNIFNKYSVNSNFLGRLCDEHDDCKADINKLDYNRRFASEGFYTESSCNNFLKNFIDKIKKRNNNLSKDVVVCDNRIDNIDKKFAEFIYSDSPAMQEKPFAVYA